MWLYLALAGLGAWAWQRSMNPTAPFVGPVQTPADRIRAAIAGRVKDPNKPNTVYEDTGHTPEEGWGPGYPPDRWPNLSLPLNDPRRVQSDGNSVVQQPGSPLGLTINEGSL